MARAAIAFDISEFTGKEVSKAELVLTYSESSSIIYMYYGGNSTNHEYEVYKAPNVWVAETVSWDTPWEKEGAIGLDTEIDSPLAKETAYNIKENETLSFDVTSLVKNWASGEEANNGFIVHAPNEIGELISSDYSANDGVYARFHSVEAADEAKRPKLRVTYDMEEVVIQTFATPSNFQCFYADGKLSISNPFEQVGTITIHTVHGQIVYQNSSINSVIISELLNLNSGIYLITIACKASSYTGKIKL